MGQRVVGWVASLLAAVPSHEAQPAVAQGSSGILALRGLGREIWRDVDAQDYVGRIRDEWDDR
ncbi:MAG: hypothetical protein FJ265_10630 [Planctomycetes bacterium]|nr:hypothetical protein [Planctomycetota bacterium]